MAKRWITGEEILEQMQWLDFELADAFMDGCTVDGRNVKLMPINKITGDRPIHICMSCEFSTFEGTPGDHYFNNPRRYACAPAPGTGPGKGCCYAAYPRNILIDKLKLHYFLSKEVEEFQGFKAKSSEIIQASLQADDPVFSADDESSQNLPEQESDLSPKEKQELGRLRAEKEKWDLSIQAALNIGLSLRDGCKVTKADLWKVLNEQEGFQGTLPDTTFLKIWQMIPNKFRNLGGRPKIAGSKKITS